MAGLCIVGLCGQSVFMTVPHFHTPGETVRANSLFTEPGGKGYNQAVAAARLGVNNVSFIGAVGADESGAVCEKRLTREGVAPCLIRKENQNTAYACILTDGCGETRVTVYPGAAQALTGADVARFDARIKMADMLLLNGEIPRDAFAQAVSLAREAGTTILLNPAPYSPFLNEFLPFMGCVMPNESELCAMLSLPQDFDFFAPCAEKTIRDAAARLHIKRLAITLGHRGALVLTGEESVFVPAFLVRAADTTGAGDTFCAALCARLLSDASLPDAARYACAAAACSVRFPHVLDALPTPDDVRALIN